MADNNGDLAGIPFVTTTLPPYGTSGNGSNGTCGRVCTQIVQEGEAAKELGKQVPWTPDATFVNPGSDSVTTELPKVREGSSFQLPGSPSVNATTDAICAKGKPGDDVEVSVCRTMPGGAGDFNNPFDPNAYKFQLKIKTN
jgi:hypothetical protein